MQILSTGASRIPEAFHAQFPVFATPRPTKLLVAREKKPLPKVAEVFCRRAAVSAAVLTTTPCARSAPNGKKNAVSQRLECCHLLLMCFRMVSACFLSSLSTQEQENDEEDYVLPCSNSEATRACVLLPNARLGLESMSALHEQ